jgi:NADPH2:quinone reductase
MTATMRAWQSPEETGITALRVVDAAIPSPGANEVVVEVGAAALNFSDLLMIDGAYQIRPDRPFTPGQEIAGTVSKSGAESGLTPGTRVAGKVLWGGFADYAVLRSDMAITVPEGINLGHAVALPVVYTTALVALVEEAGIEAGDTVLIHAAAGGVGLAAVQIAKAYGARVIAAATGPKKCDLVRAQGADVVVDYGAEDFVAAVAAASDGNGADIIVDSVGGEVTRKSLRCLAWEGQLLIVGFSSGEIPEIPANRLLLRRAVARGIYWDHDRDAEMVARCVRTLIELCLDGRIRPVIDDRYGFDDLPRALEDLKAGRSVGKLVLKMRDGASPA